VRCACEVALNKPFPHRRTSIAIPLFLPTLECEANPAHRA
jgi:hypothetical protein